MKFYKFRSRKYRTAQEPIEAILCLHNYAHEVNKRIALLLQKRKSKNPVSLIEKDFTKLTYSFSILNGDENKVAMCELHRQDAIALYEDLQKYLWVTEPHDKFMEKL